MVLTVSHQIWGLLLKERICSPREQILSFKSSPQMRREMGLDYLMRKYILSPLLNQFPNDCHSHLFSNSLTFPGLSKFPWPSTKFPDFSLTWKKFHFLIVATQLQSTARTANKNSWNAVSPLSVLYHRKEVILKTMHSSLYHS